MSSVVEKPDLATLIQSSPALKALPEAEFQQLRDGILQLPPQKQEDVRNALLQEQQQILAIDQEYDQKEQELYQNYLQSLQETGRKMTQDLRLQMESDNRKQETAILDGLLQQLDNM